MVLLLLICLVTGVLNSSEVTNCHVLSCELTTEWIFETSVIVNNSPTDLGGLYSSYYTYL